MLYSFLFLPLKDWFPKFPKKYTFLLSEHGRFNCCFKVYNILIVFYGYETKRWLFEFYDFLSKGGQKTKINGAKIVIVDNQHENSLWSICI